MRTKVNKTRSQGQLNINSVTKKREVQENAIEQVTVGFNFESDFLKVWCKMNNSKLITQRIKETLITFDI